MEMEIAVCLFLFFQILHWCYETASQMHAAASDPSKNLSKVRFWTEQLKQIHMIRYGALGNSLENVRRILKETRLLIAKGDRLVDTDRQNSFALLL